MRVHKIAAPAVHILKPYKIMLSCLQEASGSQQSTWLKMKHESDSIIATGYFSSEYHKSVPCDPIV